MTIRNPLLDLLGIRLPIIQAPMAGVCSPGLAAAVSEAGALGSIGVGATDATGAREMIAEVRARSTGPLNVNVFCHRPAVADAVVEAAWTERLRSAFEEFGASPPAKLTEIYRSFVEDDDMLAMLLEERPSVVSFHFGLPSGIHAVVAQGWEAGGHRGGTMALTRLLVRGSDLPVITAGGIMDGQGIAAALKLGASAAQLGTAFIACEESLADEGYRAALASNAADHTTMTRAISGRPARSLANRFTALGADVPARDIPAYPIAYDLGKALCAAGKARGEFGFGAQWAGQGAPLARTMPAARLVETLAAELERAL